jgi:hypothetical protein
MNNTQIFDILVDELRTMHNENLIHILHDNAIDRSFQFHYTQEIQGRGRRSGQIHIDQDRDDNLFVEHYLTINGCAF